MNKTALKSLRASFGRLSLRAARTEIVDVCLSVSLTRSAVCDTLLEGFVPLDTTPTASDVDR